MVGAMYIRELEKCIMFVYLLSIEYDGTTFHGFQGTHQPAVW